MNYHKIDVVYILKEDCDPSELIYSLRSLDRNFPHRKVWFVCGNPDGLTPDGFISHTQTGTTKWARVKSSLIQIANNPDISDQFFLFNDDFFVIKRPPSEFVNYIDGSLNHRIQQLYSNIHRSSNYIKQLENLNRLLIAKHLDTMNFALHLPMLIDKDKIIETLNKIDSPMFRSAYGNIHDIPYTRHKDIKIYDNITAPDPDCDYLSTTEQSFKDGKVGQYIRNMFKEPSRFEEHPKSLTYEHYTEDGDLVYA